MIKDEKQFKRDIRDYKTNPYADGYTQKSLESKYKMSMKSMLEKYAELTKRKPRNTMDPKITKREGTVLVDKIPNRRKGENFVSMCVHKDILFVATNHGVFRLNSDNQLERLKFVVKEED